MHQACRLDLRTIETRYLAAVAESRGIYADRAARDASIAIRTHHARIVDDGGVIRGNAGTESTVEAAPPPGMDRFKRRQRHPAHPSKSKPDAKSKARAESEEANIGRRPERRAQDRSRIPGPTTRAPEPTAIVIRRPAPGIGAHPGPAIVVFPNPASVLIRRPIRTNVGGLPNRT